MGLRILVIEDNPSNLELMTYLLTAFGHEAITARDGEAGVQLALSAPPDLVLCDLSLPRLDGFGVVAALRSGPFPDGIPIVAVSASPLPGDHRHVLARGFDGYIAKPITPDTFVREVESYCTPDRDRSPG
jgi:CheY-like chemotaxis protein